MNVIERATGFVASNLRKLAMDRKGIGIFDLPAVAIALGVAGLFFAFVLQVTGDVDNTFTAGSDESQALGNFTGGILNTSSRMPIIGTLIGVAILIGVLVNQFAGGGARRGGRL